MNIAQFSFLDRRALNLGFVLSTGHAKKELKEQLEREEGSLRLTFNPNPDGGLIVWQDGLKLGLLKIHSVKIEE